MKKIKYLLMLSILVFALGCILVGCEITGKVDGSARPIMVMYCANGGTIGDKAERYLFIEKGVTVPEPGVSSAIETPVRNGYKFIGWVEGKVDNNVVFPDPSNENKLGGVHYSPKLKDGENESSTVTLHTEYDSDNKPTYSLEYHVESEYGAQDGGVFMTIDGAVTGNEVIDIKNNETIAQTTKDAIRYRLYDYERKSADGEVPLYDFTKRIDGENFKTDIVLIAVWANYNQFIVADKTDDNEWESHEVYDELINSMRNDPNWIEGDAYLALKESGRIFDVSNGGGTEIYGAEIMTAYHATRNNAYYVAGLTVEEKKADMEEKLAAWEKIDPNGQLATQDARDAQEAYLNAYNEYNAAEKKYGEEKANIQHTVVRYYDNEDLSPESDLTNMGIYAEKGVYDVGENQLTVFYYTEIEGNVNVVFEYDNLKTALQDDEHKDIYIDSDIDAPQQDMGFSINKTALKDIKIIGNGKTWKLNTQLQQDNHADDGLPNIYGAIFASLDGVTISDLNIEINTNFEIRYAPYEFDYDDFGEYILDENGQRIPVPENAECYVGLLASTIINSTIENVHIAMKYSITRNTITHVYRNPNGQGWLTEIIENDFDVKVFFTNNLQAKGEDTDGNNKVSGCTCKAEPKAEEPEA